MYLLQGTAIMGDTLYLEMSLGEKLFTIWRNRRIHGNKWGLWMSPLRNGSKKYSTVSGLRHFDIFMTVLIIFCEIQLRTNKRGCLAETIFKLPSKP